MIKVVVNPHKPWFYSSNTTDCKGILCELLKYLCSSLKLNYTLINEPATPRMFDEKRKEFQGTFEIFQKNV